MNPNNPVFFQIRQIMTAFNKKLGTGGGGAVGQNAPQLGYFKSDYDETWYTMGRNLFKLGKSFDDVIVISML